MAQFKSEKITTVNGNDVYIRDLCDYQAPFHAHDNTEEMFFVISGNICIDFDSHFIELGANEFYTVTVGQRHRIRVEAEARVLVVSRGLKG